MNPRLITLSGPLAGQTVAIGDQAVTFGRHASNRLSLREVAVSRHHAVLERGDGGFTVRDLGSRHGTRVNGEPATQRHLTHGDLIAVCGSTFLFLVHQAPDGASASAAVRFDESTIAGPSALTLDATATNDVRPEQVIAAMPAGDRRARALGALLRAGTDLAASPSLDELADALLGLVLDALPAERAALLLATPAGDGFDPVFARERTDDRTGELDQAMTVSQTVTLRVLKEKVALVANDLRRTNELEAAASLETSGVGALVCVPLVTARSGPQGVLYLDRQGGAGFDDDDLRLATAFAGMAAPVIAHLRHLAWVEGERRRLHTASLDHDMVGESKAIRQVIEMIARVAPTGSTVLLRGESGTGKELAARAVHRGSERRDRPFVTINCATLDANLLESELFGHEKGAFTGAVGRKIGKLEVADTGSVFLDEVGELPLDTQAKLLRVLQERAFERVGGTRPIAVDLRVIAATNRDLEAAIEAGTFRRDLFYRLDVIAITLPPLRRRRGDVPRLAGHFAAHHAAALKRATPRFAPEAEVMLERYDWPGNVRELSNAIERALVLCSDDVVRAEDLPETLHELSGQATGDPEVPAATYHAALRDTKKQLIKRAVRDAQGNITQAAKALDLHPNYLHRLIKNLALRPELL